MQKVQGLLDLHFGLFLYKLLMAHDTTPLRLVTSFFLAASMEIERRNSPRVLSPNPNPTSIIVNLDQKNNRETKELPDCPSLNSSVLFSIARLLDTMNDYYAFCGVCQIWRYAAAPAPDVLPSQHPLVAVRLNKVDCEGLYDIIAHRLYRIEPGLCILSYAHGFIVTRACSRIKLTNIFTKTEIWLPWSIISRYHIILSKNPSFPDCIVVSFTPKEIAFKYCRTGGSQWVYRWTIHKKRNDPKVFDDMIFFKEKLYASSEGDLLLVELFPDLRITNLGGNDTLRKDEGLEWKLAELGGELLLVCCNTGIVYLKAKGHRRYQDGIIIYVWDFEGRKWEKRSSLGRKALFIGYNFDKRFFFGGSVAPPNAGFKIRGDCIYIADPPTDDWYVYSLEDKSVQSYLMAEQFKMPNNKCQAQPIWVLPSLC